MLSTTKQESIKAIIQYKQTEKGKELIRVLFNVYYSKSFLSWLEMARNKPKSILGDNPKQIYSITKLQEIKTK